MTGGGPLPETSDEPGRPVDSRRPRPAGQPRAGAGARTAFRLPHARRPRRRHRRLAARRRPATGRPCGDRNEELSRIHRIALRHLACGPLRRAGQCPPAPERVRLYLREFGRAACRGDAGPRGRARPCLRRSARGGAHARGGRGGVPHTLRWGAGRPRRRRADGQCLAVLHQRHDRPAQGRDALAPQPHALHARLFLRCGRHRRGRRCPASRAAQPCFRLLQHSLCRPRQPAGDTAWRVRPGRDFRADPALQGQQFLRRADHGEAPDRPPGGGERGRREPALDHLWRRADVCGRRQARLRALGAEAHPDLRPGASAR